MYIVRPRIKKKKKTGYWVFICFLHLIYFILLSTFSGTGYSQDLVAVFMASYPDLPPWTGYWWMTVDERPSHALIIRFPVCDGKNKIIINK